MVPEEDHRLLADRFQPLLHHRHYIEKGPKEISSKNEDLPLSRRQSPWIQIDGLKLGEEQLTRSDVERVGGREHQWDLQSFKDLH